jgi:hypothetical protein
MALLVIALLTLSFSVKGFRTVQSIEIQPEDWGSVALNEVRVMAIDAIKQSTDEASLRLLLEQWQTAANAKPSEPRVGALNVDLEKLRAKLSFAIIADARARNLVLHLGYTGRGAETEREFLKLFSKSVCSNLSQNGKLTSKQLATIKYDPSVVEQGRAVHSQLMTRSKEQVDVLKAQLEGVTRLVDAELTPSKTNTETETETETSDDSPLAAQLQRQLATLTFKRDELAAESNKSHPDVITVQKEIERVQAELDKSQLVKPQVLKNSFIQASYPANKVPGSKQPVRESMEHISVDGLDNMIQSLDSNWRTTVDSVVTMARSMDAALASKSLLRVEEKELVQSAVGTSIGQRSLMMALLASVLIGCTIAARMNVWSFDQGFVTQDDASAALAVPVFSNTASESRQPAKLKTSLSAKTLKMCEIVLFTALLVVAGMFVIDHEFRSIVMNNPLQAISKLIWMLRS